MKISLHQVNTTVADFSGNIGKILSEAGKARESGSSLAIFPELSVTGYPPLDLLTNPNFTRQTADALRSEEHTSELQSHSFISYAVFCLKKKNPHPPPPPPLPPPPTTENTYVMYS